MLVLESIDRFVGSVRSVPQRGLHRACGVREMLHRILHALLNGKVLQLIERIWRSSEDTHPPVSYPFALTRRGDRPEAQALLAFLTGPEAAPTYRTLGFSVRDATGGFRAFRRGTLEALGLQNVASHGYC